MGRESRINDMNLPIYWKCSKIKSFYIWFRAVGFCCPGSAKQWHPMKIHPTSDETSELTDNPRNLNVSYTKYVLIRSFIIRLVFRGKRLRGQWPAWLSSLVGFKVLITILSSTTTKSCATRQRCVIVPVGAEWAILPFQRGRPVHQEIASNHSYHSTLFLDAVRLADGKVVQKTVHIGQFQ